MDKETLEDILSSVVLWDVTSETKYLIIPILTEDEQDVKKYLVEHGYIVNKGETGSFGGDPMVSIKIQRSE